MTQEQARLAAAELWGMQKIRADLLASGTGEAKLATIDRECVNRQKAGVVAAEPVTADEWQVASEGARRAAESIIAENSVTRGKAEGFVAPIVRAARAARDASHASSRTVEAAAVSNGRRVMPAGIVARLGADPNCVGLGVLYRWRGDGREGRVFAEGPDTIDLVSGDVVLNGDQLEPHPRDVGVIRITRANGEVEERVLGPQGVSAPLKPLAKAAERTAGGESAESSAASAGSSAPAAPSAGSSALPEATGLIAGLADPALEAPTAVPGATGGDAAPKAGDGPSIGAPATGAVPAGPGIGKGKSAEGGKHQGSGKH